MKKNYLIPLITAIFVLYMPATGQNTEQPESITVFTDRSLYITGETIHFSAVWGNEGDSAEKVMYVELITPDGKSITGGKFRIRGSEAHGCLQVPAVVVTGTYYLRAYTRYMRNPGAGKVEYLPLKLVNPVSREVLTQENRSAEGRNLPQAVPLPSGGIFTLSADKSVYHAREKALISLKRESGAMGLIKSMNLTVVPEHTLEVSGYDHAIRSTSQPAEGIFRMETRGASLSGTLVEKSTGRPVSGGVVTLSVMGDRDFSAYRTESDGKFFFTLPDYTGSREIFLSAAGVDQGSASLLIDNDFTTVPLVLPDPLFSLTEQERKAALNLAVNQMVAGEYGQQMQVKRDSTAGEKRPFYGLPTETLYIDKFVQLPTLEEYFNELPVDVRVRERKEGKYFRFNSREAGMMVHDPLVLVDWVVISDISRLLQISPQRIERIEIVNKPYVKGNLTYGGIISILSRAGDFAGIDLPASGLFLKYNLLSPECVSIQELPEASAKPDARNTLLWLPALETGTDQHISLTLPDTPGTYEVVLRGVLSDGRSFGQSLPIRVE